MPSQRLELIARLRSEITACGPDDPRTWEARVRLAEAYLDHEDDHHQDWAALAAGQLAAAVDGLTRHLGAEHPDTLAVRCRWALVTFQAGDEAGGAAALRAVAQAHERVLGPAHPGTLRAWAGLWFLDPAPPPGLPERIVAGWEAVVASFGSESPAALDARQNLMGAYASAGRDADRAAEAGRIVAGWGRIAGERAERLGPVHPETTRARARHAHTHRFLRDGEQSTEVGLVAAIAEDHVRLLGITHPDTVRARIELALRCFEGDADTPRAIALATELLSAGAGPADTGRLRLVRGWLIAAHAASGDSEAALAVMARHPLPGDDT
jgi:hypothetical protein